MDRRQFLKLSAAAGAAALVPLKLGGSNGGFGDGLISVREAFAVSAADGLSDPAMQPKFANLAPNALAPEFIYRSPSGKYKIAVEQSAQMTGLVAPDGVTPVPTTVWGYGPNGRGFSWPGLTFEVQSGEPIEVKWENKLGRQHLLPVDTSLHWAYSLPGYDQYSIEKDGVPIVTHLHGGHTDSPFDGNPEFFFSPGYTVRGPQWVDKKYIYHNDQPAGNLWYHDHALGITRLNVYAGLAGFYFIRDSKDPGTLLPSGPDDLGLPKYPYELAYAIQDRMFRNTGELFYPAYPGDPAWNDFITGEGVDVCPDDSNGDDFCVTPPSALAEFFGDHMVVNGVIWPKTDVEPRNYRLRLLNGCDSRFLAIRFRPVPAGATDLANAGAPLPFYVIGSDQGLASSATLVEDYLVFEPGGRYDVVIDFSDPALDGQRVIMENIGGDAPFGGDIPGPMDFNETNRIMAFDVTLNLDDATTALGLPPQADNFDPNAISVYGGNNDIGTPTTRKVALFEGKDEYGRLQPLLGTLVNNEWKAIAWHSPTTENPGLNTTEEWWVYNFTGDAHPVHLHLVNFQILGRNEITFDSDDGDPGQEVLQHNGTTGIAPTITNVNEGAAVNLGPADGYVENAPKDMVTALPEQVTKIKATFDKPGRYVWHCHILSHEDHEMMRVLHVGPGA